VAAATRDALVLLGTDDTVRWSHAPSSTNFLPIDVFPIRHNGETLVAVGFSYGFTSTAYVDEIDAHRDGNAPVFAWQLNGTGFPLGDGVASVTTSPLDPAHLFALVTPLSSQPAAAWDVDPYAATKTLYLAYPAVGAPQTIYAIVDGAAHHTVWVDPTANAFWYTLESGSAPSYVGPASCTGLPCTLVHAVPDPTDGTRYIALCEQPASIIRNIVRWSPGGSCSVLYQGTSAGANTRLSRLAVALP
jgi:hypothetical protein